jgi:hypothetical protein
MSDEASGQISTAPKPKGFWAGLMDHVWFVRIAGAASIIGIIGLPLSIYLYVESIQKPKLCYAINPVRTSILKKGQFSELNVSMGGTPITNDLTAVQIAIWNAGNLPIRHDDILKPIVIRSKVNALVYKITIMATRDVTGFRPGPHSSTEYGMDWTILEHNDGALIQIFYGGDENVDFTIDGILIGQKTPVKLVKPNITFRATIVNAFTFTSWIVVFLSTKLEKKFPFWRTGFGWALILCSLAISAAALSWALISVLIAIAHHTTPFGF